MTRSIVREYDTQKARSVDFDSFDPETYTASFSGSRGSSGFLTLSPEHYRCLVEHLSDNVPELPARSADPTVLQTSRVSGQRRGKLLLSIEEDEDLLVLRFASSDSSQPFTVMISDQDVELFEEDTADV